MWFLFVDTFLSYSDDGFVAGASSVYDKYSRHRSRFFINQKNDHYVVSDDLVIDWPRWNRMSGILINIVVELDWFLGPSSVYFTTKLYIIRHWILKNRVITWPQKTSKINEFHLFFCPQKEITSGQWGIDNEMYFIECQSLSFFSEKRVCFPSSIWTQINRCGT